MNIEELRLHLEEQSLNLCEEFKRLFHGRGGLYEPYKYLTIDAIDTILSVALYFETSEANEAELLTMLQAFMQGKRFTTLVVQRRYIFGAPSQIIVGEVPEKLNVIENGMKFRLNLLSNKNNGFFADMKNGRSFVREHAMGKNVLNLFAYTCAFSVAALKGGAASVVNVDMSKGALSTGKANHAINNIDTRGISFLPYNILKSFSGLKKKGPYDLIIIDPPSFQKGSFEATKDYRKIIQRLKELASEDGIVLACLNSPELTSDFLIDLFKEEASQFSFVKRLENVAEFKSSDEERSLKNLVFQRTLL
jgi:23S rRNA (cytosine1962-C5)-methyltransferase